MAYLYGLSGRQCTLAIGIRPSGLPEGQADFIPYQPLLQQINIPASFFTFPVQSLGTDTIVALDKGIIPQRTIEATIAMQGEWIPYIPLFFTVSPGIRGTAIFNENFLIAWIGVTWQGNVIYGLPMPSAIISSWRWRQPNDDVATMTFNWVIPTIRPLGRQFPPNILLNTLIGDEILTIANLSFSGVAGVGGISIPSDGIAGFELELNRPVQFHPLIGISNDYLTDYYTTGQVTIMANLQLAPHFAHWLASRIEEDVLKPYYTLQFIYTTTLHQLILEITDAKPIDITFPININDAIIPTLRFQAAGFNIIAA